MNKFALLIGVNGYVNLSRLHYAASDARETARLLRQNYGFSDSEILLMTDDATGHLYPSTEYIREQVQNLIQHENLDLLVFGFWGHGFARNATERYLCGILSEENRLGQSAISLPIVIATLKQASATNTCMILDCCQNAVEGRGTAGAMLSGERNRARDIILTGTHNSEPLMASPKSRSFAILNSCDEGQRAYEWDERGHGLFSTFLLEAMEQKIPSIADIAQYVTPKVQQRAQILGKNQTPCCDIHGAGDVMLLSRVEPPQLKNVSQSEDVLRVSPFMPELPKASTLTPPPLPSMKVVPPPIHKPLDVQISEGLAHFGKKCRTFAEMQGMRNHLLTEYQPSSPTVMDFDQKLWQFAEVFLQEERQLRDLCKVRLDQLRAEGRLEGSPFLQRISKVYTALNTHMVRMVHEPRTLDEITQMVQTFQQNVLGDALVLASKEQEPQKSFYKSWLRIPTWITIILSLIAFAIGILPPGPALETFFLVPLVMGIYVYPCCLVLELVFYLVTSKK